MHENEHYRGKSMKQHFATTKNVVNNFFKGNEEYLCKELPDFLGNINLPMPLTKQQGVSFILISQGSLDIWLAYEKITVSAGQLIIIQAQKPYAIDNCSADLKGYILQLKGGSALGSMGNHSLIFNLEFLETWSDSVFEIREIPLEYIENLFKRLYWESTQQQSKMFVVNAYVITLLLELNNTYNDAVHANKAAIDIVRRFKNAIYINMSKPLTISDFAGQLSITPNHLNKSVKALSGMSASQLMNKIKITEAKYLLMMAEYNVGEVAERLGFNDASYFSRYFRKHTQLTPLEFQKLIDLS